MALQFRRGTAADRTSWGGTPVAGEPLYTTDDNKLYVGDGSTPGGTYVLDKPIGTLNNVTTIDQVVRTIVSYGVASNVATIALTAAHDYYAGLSVTISGSSIAALNGTFTLTGTPNNQTFTFALTTADVAAGTAATGTVTPNLGAGDILFYSTNQSRFITGPNAPAFANNVGVNLVGNNAPTVVSYLAYDGSDWVAKDLNPYVQFSYAVGSAPTGAVANSELLGRNQGTMTLMDFANKATNGNRGPSSADFNSTLAGITFASATGHFTGFDRGDYLIQCTANIYINNPTPTNATPPRLHLTPTATDTGAAFLYSQTSQIGLLPHASYGSAQAVISQTVYLMCTMENNTAANNQFFIALDQNISNTYFVNDAIVTITKMLDF